MTNQINELTQMRVDDATSIATDLLEKIATSKEWRDVLRRGRDQYGSLFAAFLLVPFIRDRTPDQLVSLCGRTFAAEGRDEDDAREMLLDLNGWNDKRVAANRQIGFEGVLTWDETRLQEALDARYWFVQTYDGCFVFDRTRLEPEQ